MTRHALPAPREDIESLRAYWLAAADTSRRLIERARASDAAVMSLQPDPEPSRPALYVALRAALAHEDRCWNWLSAAYAYHSRMSHERTNPPAPAHPPF